MIEGLKVLVFGNVLKKRLRLLVTTKKTGGNSKGKAIIKIKNAGFSQRFYMGLLSFVNYAIRKNSFGIVPNARPE